MARLKQDWAATEPDTLPPVPFVVIHWYVEQLLDIMLQANRQLPQHRYNEQSYYQRDHEIPSLTYRITM